MDTLTKAEYLIARQAYFYSKWAFGDGRGNYTPEAMVAIARGAKFDGWYPLKKQDLAILNKAMSDLSIYLNFASVNEYCDALQQYGKDIFMRRDGGNA